MCTVFEFSYVVSIYYLCKGHDSKAKVEGILVLCRVLLCLIKGVLRKHVTKEMTTLDTKF